MTKAYETYQKLEGEPETSRDKEEIGSDFWNEGKFNNFVKPFLKEGKKFVDMGGNAGLHAKMAEDMGFEAIVVDNNKGAIQRGESWRDKNGYKYRFVESKLHEAIDDLPVVDYTVFINAHYYMTVNEFLGYLDKLRRKTRYCIIVTDEKNHMNRCWASADEKVIQSYFREWDNVGYIGEMPLEGKHARKLTSFCFRSPWVEMAEIKDLDSSNHVQDEFCAELDEGKHYKETKYYKIIKPYRKKWSQDKLERWFEERVENYESIKKNGLRVPIIIDSNDEILDGNHRYAAMRHLGNKDIFVEKI